MKKLHNLIIFLYRHKFVRYLLVGGTTFALDFSLLILLHGILGANVLVAASVSYWSSIMFNFITNRYWTFNAKEISNLHRHIFFYGLLLGANYLFTVISIGALTSINVHYTIAKILSVGIQMSWTYFAYKKIFN